VPGPALPAAAALKGVAATSDANAWAVGGSTGALIEHWNGTAWTRVPAPALSMGSLEGVTALSATSAWAVGTIVDKGDRLASLIERWNGSSWARVPSPAAALLVSVTATSARDAWAVGFSSGGATGIIEHWNGSSWACLSATGTAGPCPPV